jgi:hypothetical protein
MFNKVKKTIRSIISTDLNYPDKLMGLFIGNEFLLQISEIRFSKSHIYYFSKITSSFATLNLLP